ncbi:hypothetical protein GA0074695_6465 [Micromonospora viridifaciens]|uniref:Uncharacterized protein n=1 Tax=Micromonospora viridifaciens TaxID=1881 RepID=A0A1C5A161_MICVI|nr:hypothetical protein [Micromonospora viridifaciens]SCF38957.1 hypothetical protein GA0074695_6465 [Micromonospora viridifaciens]
MEAVRRQLRILANAAAGMVASVIILGGPAIGLSVLAEYLRDTWLVPRMLALIGVYVLGGGVLLITALFFRAVLGPNRAEKLFSVRSKVLTPDVVHDLGAKQVPAALVPIASGQGVLRIIAVKPEWWLDDAYADDAAPVVTVEGVEHRLPGWDPYDIAVPAGAVEVVAWVPRRSRNPGRRVYNSFSVPEGRVGAVVFRPSSIPEVPGTVESLDSELTGRPSLFRLALGAALLIGVAYTVWRLAAG